jgi:PQQ-dependent catabolism-associated CXXCW motif protein
VLRRRRADAQPSGPVSWCGIARQLPLGLALCIWRSAAQAQVGRPTAAKLPPGPELDAVAAQGYHQQFKPAPGQKAFAVSRDAKAYAAVIGREQSFEAVRGASVGCLAQFKTLCQIWLVNDEVVWPHYAKSRAASQAALKTLRQRAQQPFAEAVAAAASDAPVPTQLRSGEQMHGSTPDAAPAGSRLIDTAGVVRLLTQARKPLLIDTLHGKSLIRSSLPTAHWLQGAGWEDPSLNTRIDAHLRLAMRALTPSKSTPIVVFCSNADCWLSWNAALRLVQAGYREVHWYRGGVDAWKRAGLPMVDTPLSGHLW